MRTTLDIDDELLAAAKSEAAKEGATLTRLVEDGLRLRLAARTQGQRLPTAADSGAGGLILPSHIDINDTSAVLDFLDADS